MSLVQTDTSSRQLSAQNRDLLNTDSVRIKTIVVGDTENGRTARVLDIKNAASLVGTVTKTLLLTTVPPMTSLFHVSAALHHQTVMKLRIKMKENFLTHSFDLQNRFMQKYPTLQTDENGWRIQNQYPGA